MGKYFGACVLLMIVCSGCDVPRRTDYERQSRGVQTKEQLVEKCGKPKKIFKYGDKNNPQLYYWYDYDNVTFKILEDRVELMPRGFDPKHPDGPDANAPVKP